MWRQEQPAAAVSRRFLDPRATPALRIHRRSLLGVGRGAAGLAALPVQVWLLARWKSSAARRAIAAVPVEQRGRFAAATGVPAGLQLSRLLELARNHAIAPRDAYRLGLLRDGWPQRWAEFAYDSEPGWNAAAGTVAGRLHIRALGDKVATANRLSSVGIACVPEIRVTPVEARTEDTDALVARWLARWSRVHGKRRVGSRGEGAFELTKDGPGWVLREYQSAGPVADPRNWLREHLAAQEYLIQPRLVSHSMFDGVADPTDVVTVRIFTRDVGTIPGRGVRARSTPHLFSACLEVPVAPTSVVGRAYALLRVDSNGFVGPPAVPAWLPAVAELSATEASLGRAQRELLGRRLPNFEGMLADALRAHRQFPGLFAAAWDVAVTDEGSIFLEGNAGFGTAVPQWLGGGLFAELGETGESDSPVDAGGDRREPEQPSVPKSQQRSRRAPQLRRSSPRR